MTLKYAPDKIQINMFLPLMKKGFPLVCYALEAKFVKRGRHFFQAPDENPPPPKNASCP